MKSLQQQEAERRQRSLEAEVKALRKTLEETLKYIDRLTKGRRPLGSVPRLPPAQRF